MITTQRKRHLQVWVILAFLLPAGILCGWLAVPRPIADQLPEPMAPPALQLVLGHIEHPGLSVRLRASADTAMLQLEWIARKAVTAPSALVYAGPDLLGRIGPQGVYRFSFPRPADGRLPTFTLYDIIHHRVTERINF